jgi:hypothetical protein
LKKKIMSPFREFVSYARFRKDSDDKSVEIVSNKKFTKKSKFKGSQNKSNMIISKHKQSDH